MLNPNGFDDKVDEDYISVYLENIDAKNIIGTHIYAKCLLTIRNYKDYSNYFIDNGIYIYNFIFSITILNKTFFFY